MHVLLKDVLLTFQPNNHLAFIGCALVVKYFMTFGSVKTPIFLVKVRREKACKK
jgi:hypothetical protein